MGRWEVIEPLFDELDHRRIDQAAELERWLLDAGELLDCLEEVYAGRFVATTCHTDDEAAKKAFLEFIEQIEPKCKPRWQKFRERYVASPARGSKRSRRGSGCRWDRSA